MTSDLFVETITKLYVRMKAENRKILLFVDNCPSHPKLIFSNVKLEFFPPNAISVLQPMDQGIIKSSKSHYRHKIIRKLVYNLVRKFGH